jgi:hypothetical protein
MPKEASRNKCKGQKLSSIPNLFCSRVAGTVRTAEDLAIGFHAMADDPTLAMGTGRGEGMDRTLETIKRVTSAGNSNLHALVILVATDFAFRHRILLSW